MLTSAEKIIFVNGLFNELDKWVMFIDKYKSDFKGLFSCDKVEAVFDSVKNFDTKLVAIGFDAVMIKIIKVVRASVTTDSV